MENVRGEGEQECWFKEGGCIESSEMESGSWNDNPGSKLDDENKTPTSCN